MITIPLSKQGKNAGKYQTIVDDVDADLAEFNWMCRVDTPNVVYAARTDNRDNCRTLHMHRIILERKLDRKLRINELTFHINGNRLDNRRDNLRTATRLQIRWDGRKHKTGYKGVSNVRGRYRATIQINGKPKSLGYFDTPEQAHAAYCEAAKEHFGEFANEG